MWKAILQRAKATFPLAIGLLSTLCSIPALSQQTLISNKDQTRPEMVRQFAPLPARVFTFSAPRFNGYNDIQWTATREQATRKFIVEYRYDGVNFQTAGQAMSADGLYQLKH